MKQLLLILILLPIIGNAQEPGIKWTTNLSWEQIKVKAKAENKYIFIDAYATWCGPCKWMDKNIYPSQKVGDGINDKFISFKIQMDTTTEDNQMVKSWYNAALSIRQKFNVSEFPTYLFLSPDGDIVHKGIGLKREDEFLMLTRDALDPAKQYYTLLKMYNMESNDYGTLIYLATEAQKIGDNDIAKVIADKVINNYFVFLQKDSLYFKDKIKFLSLFTRSSKDWGFKFFYQNSKVADSVMKAKHYSENITDYIITKENIDPVLLRVVADSSKSPNWKKLFRTLKSKYGFKYAERNILNAQERYYGYKNDNPNLHKVYVKKFHLYGVSAQDTQLETDDLRGVNNNMAWDIFESSKDKATINTAVTWMGIIIKTTKMNDTLVTVLYDTYANLLHKSGRTDEAIQWEMKAIDKALKLGDQKTAKTLQYIVDKMKSGKATWPDN